MTQGKQYLPNILDAKQVLQYVPRRDIQSMYNRDLLSLWARATLI